MECAYKASRLHSPRRRGSAWRDSARVPFAVGAALGKTPGAAWSDAPAWGLGASPRMPPLGLLTRGHQESLGNPEFSWAPVWTERST